MNEQVNDVLDDPLLRAAEFNDDELLDALGNWQRLAEFLKDHIDVVSLETMDRLIELEEKNCNRMHVLKRLLSRKSTVQRRLDDEFLNSKPRR